MVEAIHETVSPTDGPRGPPQMDQHEAFDDNDVGNNQFGSQDNNADRFAASNTFNMKRLCLKDSEVNKLDLKTHCEKPNREVMGEAKFESSVREMMSNRIYLDEDERKEFGDVVK